MKIFYYGHDRCGSSLIAGYIHLRKLPLQMLPTVREISEAYNRAIIERNINGSPFFLGNDAQNNEIYAVGFGKDYQLALQTIANMHTADWKFYSAIDEENSFTGWGGFVLNRLQLSNLGIKLFAYGARRSYPRLVKLVKRVKELNRIE